MAWPEDALGAVAGSSYGRGRVYDQAGAVRGVDRPERSARCLRANAVLPKTRLACDAADACDAAATNETSTRRLHKLPNA